MKEPLVCIVLLNWNGGMLPIKCLDSLFKNTNYSNFRVIFVDNGSTDESAEITQDRFKNITFMKLKENFGFSKGMNIGAWYSLKYCEPKYILFLNNDITFPSSHKAWLSDLVQDMESDPSVAIAGPKIRTPDGIMEGAWIIKGKLFLRKHEISPLQRKKCDVTYCTGACFLIKSSVLKEIGLYDEKFSPFMFEDMDLFLRIKKSGYKILYDPKHTLNHVSSATIGKIKAEQFQKSIILFNKNMIRNRYKNFPFHVFLLTLCGALIGSFVLFGTSMKFFKSKGLFKIINLNPRLMIQLMKQIDLSKEKVRLSDKEALKRIKYIKNL